MKSIQNRKQLTDVWKENGIEDAKEYAILTNEIYKTWSGMTSKEVIILSPKLLSSSFLATLATLPPTLATLILPSSKVKKRGIYE